MDKAAVVWLKNGFSGYLLTIFILSFLPVIGETYFGFFAKLFVISIFPFLISLSIAYFLFQKKLFDETKPSKSKLIGIFSGLVISSFTPVLTYIMGNLLSHTSKVSLSESLFYIF